MAEEKKNKQLALAIIDFLQTAGKSVTDEERESLDVASQCIQEVFGVDIHDETQQKEFHHKPGTLLSIFEVYLKTQQKMAKATKSAKSEVSAEDIKKADELKNMGNKKVGEKQFDEAVKLYNQAIELNPDNAIYYSNRAAAYSQMGRHPNAIQDAKKSLELDPTYSKAYSRLGFACYSIGDYPEAVAAYTKALEFDPDNSTVRATLDQAKARLDATAPVVEEPEDDDSGKERNTSRAAGSTPGAGAGGMPDLSSLLGNPNIMNMAQQMMSNPQFAQMAQGLMGGGGGGSGGGLGNLAGLMNNPNLANMAQQAMQDPNMMNMLGNLGGSGAGGSDSAKSKKSKK